MNPVLILGGGVNGAALARELVLNGVPVWLVDRADLAFGATSKSSRLIHGGLRYLEYGDFHLVRESLEERARLLELAPHLVEPLRLYIPVRKRTGGMLQAAARFLGGSRSGWFYKLFEPLRRGKTERGLWVVRMGLWFYDRFARDKRLPAHNVLRIGTGDAPDVDAGRFRWVCGYSDAQMRFPERFVVALLTDARQIAEEHGVEFRVLTYHTARFEDGCVVVEPADKATSRDAREIELTPSVIVNATGAWGDFTLDELGVDAPKLFGGTKGSHLLTGRPGLREAIHGSGVYAEASDGRLVFVLPFGRESVLVGTTDVRFEQPPDRAVATEEELEYLIGLVNELFPTVGLSRADVSMHYSGVRPLPNSKGGKTSSISRDHRIESQEHAGVRVLTLVGGKLTTARAFAEEAADQVFDLVGVSRNASTRERPIPGASGAAANEEAGGRQSAISLACFSDAQIRAMRELRGNDFAACVDPRDAAAGESVESVPGTNLPYAFVRDVIETEWVTTLSDLVERRLMLVYAPRLTAECLDALAGVLIECGVVPTEEKEREIERAQHRLAEVYGRVV